MQKQQKTVRAAERAAGACGGPGNGTPARKVDVCGEVRWLISDMRSDGYLAVRIDGFVELVNETLRDGRKATTEDVKRCLKYDDTVKIIDVDGREVLWLWGGWYMHTLIDRLAELAVKYKEVGVWFDVYAGGQ